MFRYFIRIDECKLQTILHQKVDVSDHSVSVIFICYEVSKYALLNSTPNSVMEAMIRQLIWKLQSLLEGVDLLFVKCLVSKVKSIKGKWHMDFNQNYSKELNHFCLALVSEGVVTLRSKLYQNY